MQTLIHEWGLPPIHKNLSTFIETELSLIEQTTINALTEKQIQQYFPEIIEKYNNQCKKSEKTDDLEKIIYAESISSKNKKIKIYQEILANDPNNMAAKILLSELTLSGIKLLRVIEQTVVDVIKTHTNAFEHYEDLYYSKYDWFIRGLYAVIKVLWRNDAKELALQYLGLIKAYNPGDNLGTRFYIMEQLIPATDYPQFNELFPLNEDYSMKLFHICSLIHNKEFEQALKLLNSFTMFEINVIYEKDDISNKEIQAIRNNGFIKDTYEELIALKERHRSLRQYIFQIEGLSLEKIMNNNS